MARTRLELALLSALAAASALALAAGGCGGESVVSGFGNNGNVFGSDTLERVAKELAELDNLPAVGDDELRTAWTAIRDRARAGDPDATLVLLRVAAIQRGKTEKE